MTPEFKKQIFIHVGLSLTAIVVLGCLIFIVKGDINRRVLKIQELESRLSSHARAEESLIALKAGADLADRAQAALFKYIPLSDELINFPKELAAIARDNNVQLSVSFGGEAAREDGLKELTFDIRTVSGHAEFIAFIKALEQGPRLIAIQNTTVARRSGEGSFEGLVSGKVFSRLPNPS